MRVWDTDTLDHRKHSCVLWALRSSEAELHTAPLQRGAMHTDNYRALWSTAYISFQMNGTPACDTSQGAFTVLVAGDCFWRMGRMKKLMCVPGEPRWSKGREAGAYEKCLPASKTGQYNCSPWYNSGKWQEMPAGKGGRSWIPQA